MVMSTRRRRRKRRRKYGGNGESSLGSLLELGCDWEGGILNERL